MYGRVKEVENYAEASDQAGYESEHFDWAFCSAEASSGTFGTLTSENGPIKAQEQLTRITMHY
jgi:hypothetical protein